MTPQQLAFVACRLFAVYWILNNVLVGIGLTLAFMQSDSVYVLGMVVALIASQAVVIAIGAAFWLLAGPLSRGVVRNLPSASEDLSPDGTGWSALIIMALGAYGLFRSVTTLSEMGARAQMMGTTEMVTGSGIGLLFVLSGICVLFPRKLAEALGRLTGDKVISDKVSGEAE